MKITTNVVLPKKGTTHGKTTDVKTFDQLKKIILSESYCLGTFKDGVIVKKNFESTDSIGLDFDGDYTLEQAKEDFKKFKCIIATTKSHRKAKNGVVSDRFRVILFLTEAITTNEVFLATWKKLELAFPKLDEQCKNTSRWWYKSKKIVMVNKKGMHVKPVTDMPLKDTSNTTNYLKIGKGKLSKETEGFLRKGLPAGKRNGSTFKIAKDLQENNFTEDEAITYIVKAYKDNGTLAYDFTESEVEACVRSAYTSDASHGPRQPFKLMPLSELYKMDIRTEWIVDRLLSAGGVSLWSAAPKVGKSWLARQMIYQMLTGKEFLGRKTKKGEVLYFAIEEQPEIIKKSFKKFGMPDDVPLYIHVGDIFSKNSLKDFYQVLQERKPMVAIIDTLFDFLDVESENNYKEVKTELRRLRHIARSTGTHIVCIHHANKGGNFQGSAPSGSNRTILGSQAIAGGVDAIMVIEMSGQDRVLTATGRMIKPINLRKLVWDKEKWTYTLGEKLEIEDKF